MGLRHRCKWKLSEIRKSTSISNVVYQVDECTICTRLRWRVLVFSRRDDYKGCEDLPDIWIEVGAWQYQRKPSSMKTVLTNSIYIGLPPEAAGEQLRRARSGDILSEKNHEFKIEKVTP